MMEKEIIRAADKEPGETTEPSILPQDPTDTSIIKPQGPGTGPGCTTLKSTGDTSGRWIRSDAVLASIRTRLVH